VQGGLVRGKTVPGARLAHDGRPVKVAADGRFIIGFGRDAGPRSRLEVGLPGAERMELALAVAQRRYEIQRIDGLPEAQVTPGPEVLARIRVERALISERRSRAGDTALFESGFVWPVTGVLSGVFGSQRVLSGEPRSPHLGVDIAAPEGTTVVAPTEGVVVLAHDGMFFTGRTVMIDHGHGLTSVYAHMSEVRVEEGNAVSPGTPIGAVGASGRATGAHLHWGVHLGGVGLDPALLAGPMPVPAGGEGPAAESVPEAPE
jgi:murein DD-endopeptidase MepM/ murein hydrolase activator NlpD